MSRFFKSAAFPILIVVVLAFFLSKLVVPSSQKGPVHSYKTLVTEDIPDHRVKSADLKVKDNSVAVTLNSTNKEEKYEVGFVDQQRPQARRRTEEVGEPVQRRIEQDDRSGRPCSPTCCRLVLILGFWFFLINQVQGGGSRVMSFGKSRAKRTVRGFSEDHLPRRRRGRRGRRGAARDQGVPREPEEVPGARRANTHRRAAVRPARDRQDAARARRRGRGGRAVLLDLGLRLRRDVRRRRRLARARPVRAGQAEQPLHHLHGRDRRRRAPPRRRPRRRPRRARADAQPAARSRWTASRPRTTSS